MPRSLYALHQLLWVGLSECGLCPFDTLGFFGSGGYLPPPVSGCYLMVLFISLWRVPVAPEVPTSLSFLTNFRALRLYSSFVPSPFLGGGLHRPCGLVGKAWVPVRGAGPLSQGPRCSAAVPCACLRVMTPPCRPDKGPSNEEPLKIPRKQPVLRSPTTIRTLRTCCFPSVDHFSQDPNRLSFLFSFKSPGQVSLISDAFISRSSESRCINGEPCPSGQDSP